jgi:hypothetical protein
MYYISGSHTAYFFAVASLRYPSLLFQAVELEKMINPFSCATFERTVYSEFPKKSSSVLPLPVVLQLCKRESCSLPARILNEGRYAIFSPLA